MAKQAIHHVCGHTTEAQLYGKHSERDARADALGRHPCPACAAEAAARESAAARLPLLKGSDKQIAWASEIRARILSEIDGMIDAATGRDDERAKVLAAYTRVKAQNDARCWIDHRNATPVSLIAAAAKGS